MSRTDEEIREFKEECRQEALEDMRHEQRMRSDLEYAMEQYGALDILEEITTLSTRLHELGYEMSTTEVIEYIKEM